MQLLSVISSIFTSVMIVVMFIIRRHRERLSGSWVYLTLTTEEENYSISIRPLNHAANSITIVRTPSITSLRVKNRCCCFFCCCCCCQPILEVSWMGQLVYQVCGESFTEEFPSIVPICTGEVNNIHKAVTKGNCKASMVVCDGIGNIKQLDGNSFSSQQCV